MQFLFHLQQFNRLIRRDQISLSLPVKQQGGEHVDKRIIDIFCSGSIHSTQMLSLFPPFGHYCIFVSQRAQLLYMYTQEQNWHAFEKKKKTFFYKQELGHMVGLLDLRGPSRVLSLLFFFTLNPGGNKGRTRKGIKFWIERQINSAGEIFLEGTLLLIPESS